MPEFLIRYGYENECFTTEANDPSEAYDNFKESNPKGSINTMDVVIPINDFDHHEGTGYMTASDGSYFDVNIAEVRFVPPSEEEDDSYLEDYLFSG